MQEQAINEIPKLLQEMTEIKATLTNRFMMIERAEIPKLGTSSAIESSFAALVKLLKSDKLASHAAARGFFSAATIDAMVITDPLEDHLSSQALHHRNAGGTEKAIAVKPSEDDSRGLKLHKPTRTLEMSILYALKETGGSLSFTELAESLHMFQPIVKSEVKKLEKENYVVTDKEVISITTKGKIRLDNLKVDQ